MLTFDLTDSSTFWRIESYWEHVMNANPHAVKLLLGD